MPSIEFWRTVTIIIAALGQTMFVLLYMTFPWWEEFLGRALFFKACALGLLVDVAVAGRIWDWTYEDETFVVLYAILATGIIAQFVAFLRVRLQGRQDDVARHPVEFEPEPDAYDDGIDRRPFL
jgi:ABC-type sugar transport system permease subunit